MGYLHINNLYKSQDILLFKECYALEKVHGTSAHLCFTPAQKGVCEFQLQYFSGGEKHDNFVSIFKNLDLVTRWNTLGLTNQVTVYGEAYGGKCQGMRSVYGEQLQFIVFDVKIGDFWLNVLQAAQVAMSFGLEFVPYNKITTELSAIDAERDAYSDVAIRRGTGLLHKREGVVLRPLIEVTKNNGERIIAKHKHDEFQERSTPQRILDPARLIVLTQSKEIADEWVTDMRLTHVLDKFPNAQIEQISDIIKAMIEDVEREATGEVTEFTKDVRKAIGAKTAVLFKSRLKLQLVHA